jgi:hypothetical protein
VALEPRHVEVAGELDDRPVITRFMVTPVVGLVAEPPQAFGRDEREVHEVFEVPLSRFLDPGVGRFEWWHASWLPPGLPPGRWSTAQREIDPRPAATRSTSTWRRTGWCHGALVRDLLERLGSARAEAPELRAGHPGDWSGAVAHGRAGQAGRLGPEPPWPPRLRRPGAAYRAGPRGGSS